MFNKILTLNLSTLQYFERTKRTREGVRCFRKKLKTKTNEPGWAGGWEQLPSTRLQTQPMPDISLAGGTAHVATKLCPCSPPHPMPCCPSFPSPLPRPSGVCLFIC